jgi:hypothetical protein
MKKILCFLVVLTFASCDDGDILIENFTFDGINIAACLPAAAQGTRTYVFYKVDNTNFESLSLQLTTNTEIFNEDGSFGPFPIGNTNRVEYRKYNAAPGANYFCSAVPPAEPRVNEILVSQAGNLFITTTNNALTSLAAQTNTEADTVDTDGDGIPNNLEPFGQDTDGDGLPDKIDFDDDGDNVPTLDEGTNDTDKDGIPDYLDNDDDGDGILTIQEDTNGDLNPQNDVEGTLPNYLNPAVTIAASPAIALFIEHQYTRSSQIEIRLENLILTRDGEEIVFDDFDNFGNYARPAYQVMVTPVFVEMAPNNP